MVKTRLLIGGALTVFLIGGVFVDERIGFSLIGTGALAAITMLAVGELFRLRLPEGGDGTLWLLRSFVLALFLARCFEWPAMSPLGRETLMTLLASGVCLTVQTLSFQFRPANSPDRHFSKCMLFSFAWVYIALPMGLLHDLVLHVEPGRGTRIVVALVLISKCGDIGGYLAGTFFGKHRVLPRVSPKKSWEGSLAGLVLTIAAVYGFDRLEPELLPRSEHWYLLSFALAINLATQIGDFAESMLKRAVDVKDSASLLPTFGGALDIIDSLVFAMPVAYVFVAERL